MLTSTADQTRLDLVFGPPGCGKSTLLANVAAQVGMPVVWYRLSPDDASDSSMTRHLAYALGDALQMPLHASSMTDLLSSLEQAPPTPAMVVLDDVHEIVGTAAERELEQFVSVRPHHVRVALGSRRVPDVNVPRLRVSGALREVTGDDLRFRSWEVEELFVTVFGEPLAPEDAALLTRRTGGWAAGLQLFHLATRGRSAAERHRAIENLNGRSRLVRSYLARNVIAELSEKQRLFLVKTSTLGVLTGSLCDKLLNEVGSARMLDELEQQQMFTSSEDDGGTFRYHEALKAHLEWALVEEFGSERARYWYCRSSDLLEEAGFVAEAIRASVKACDWGRVARLHQIPGFRGSIGAWSLLPPSVILDDPWLSLAEARRLVRNGSLELASAAFRRAEELMDEPAFRDHCHGERGFVQLWGRHAGGWAGGSVVGVNHWSTSVRAATRGSMVASAGTTGHLTDGCGYADVANGVVGLLAGHIDDARRVMAKISDTSPDPGVRMLARTATLIADLVSGSGTSVVERLRGVCLEAEYLGLPWFARLARGLADAVLASPGSPSWRVDACWETVAECDRVGDAWGAALLSLAAAVACEINDDVAPQDFSAVAHRFRMLDAGLLAAWAEAFQACAQVTAGEAGAEDVAHRAADAARAVQASHAEELATAAAELAAGRPPTPGDLSGRSEWSRFLITRILPGAELPATKHTHRHVEWRCFGGFRICIDGNDASLTGLRPRAQAILRFLALSAGTDIHVETLLAAFWPETPPTVATRRLQVAISGIRRQLDQLGPDSFPWLPRHGHAYRLEVAPGTVDVRMFADGLARAMSDGDVARRITMRQDALALYAELLPEDGPAEHIVVERERYKVMAVRACTALAHDLRSIGQLDGAVEAARCSVRLDPYVDQSWNLLAVLHEESGDAMAARLARRQRTARSLELESR